VFYFNIEPRLNTELCHSTDQRMKPADPTPSAPGAVLRVGGPQWYGPLGPLHAADATNNACQSAMYAITLYLAVKDLQDRLGDRRQLDPLNPTCYGMTNGSHRHRWNFKITATSNPQSTSQRFHRSTHAAQNIPRINN